MPWSDGLVRGTPAYEIAASINPFVRVVAGPGTGKSFAMKRRVARLLESGADARKVLPVTFTNVAAEDLHRELVGMGVDGCELLRGTTLHSLAMRMLMRNHVLQAIGRTARPLNEFELKPLEADLCGAHGGKRAFRRKVKAFEAAWARLQADEPGYVQSREDQLCENDLVAWLIFHEGMLVGEIVPQLHNYLRSNPAAAETTEFEEILVDEYQDLNKCEQRTIEMLSDAANVCIVGDDDQSIYSFKYAHPDGIREWANEHHRLDDLTLADCRRCPTAVVAMANSLIQYNVQRPVPRGLDPVELNGRGDVRIIQYTSLAREVAGIAELIEDLIDNGVPAGDILVLAQRSSIGTPIYEALAGRNVPVKSYYAESELDALEAQERFALLKILTNRDDKVSLRWLLGLGSDNWRAASYSRLREHCSHSSDTPWEALEKLQDGSISIPYTTPLIQRFVEIKQEIDHLDAAGSLEDVIDVLFPIEIDAFEDVRELALRALASAGEDRDEFLQLLSSYIYQPEVPAEVSEVRIMSLHKSKGLSSPVTIVSGCVEGLLPRLPDDELSQAEQDAQMEEQRRLFYVAITRVKADIKNGKPGTLILSYSQQMPMRDALASGIQPSRSYGGISNLIASRFIRELGSSAPRPSRGG